MLGVFAKFSHASIERHARVKVMHIEVGFNHEASRQLQKADLVRHTRRVVTDEAYLLFERFVGGRIDYASQFRGLILIRGSMSVHTAFDLGMGLQKMLPEVDVGLFDPTEEVYVCMNGAQQKWIEHNPTIDERVVIIGDPIAETCTDGDGVKFANRA